MHTAALAENPYSVQAHHHFAQKVLTLVEKILEHDKTFVLGSYFLFDYDLDRHEIVLTPTFRELLVLLVNLGELDDQALKARSLEELNTVLQKPQGERGGLMRKPGTERWHLKDNAAKQQFRSTFDQRLEKLGFTCQRSLDVDTTVDHCIVFGARVERMEKRIMQTLDYLKKNLTVSGHIFLLGSHRKLIPEEIEYLKGKLEKLDESPRNAWNEILSNPDQATEANAFVCLWECIVPQETQARFKDQLIGVKSTRIGSSYHDNEGVRATTEVTCEDWASYYSSSEPQAVFAVAEQPYLRLTDQLRLTVVTKGKTANIDEAMQRIRNITFYFAATTPEKTPLLSVYLDEIGRNVYRTTDILRYLCIESFFNNYNALVESEDWSEVYSQGTKALAAAKASKRTKDEAKICAQLTPMYYVIFDDNAILEYAQRCYELAEEFEDSSLYLNALGYASMSNDCYQRFTRGAAIKRITMCLSIPPSDLRVAHDGLDKVEFDYLDELNFFRQKITEKDMIRITLRQGKMHLLQQNYDLTQKLINKVREKFTSEEAAMQADYLEAQLCFELGEYTLALELANHGLMIAEELKAKEDENRFSELLKKIDEKPNQPTHRQIDGSRV